VSPAYDHAQLTALAAAGVVYDLLALFAKRPLSTDDVDRRTSGSA
jgi:hypothetical protein